MTERGLPIADGAPACPFVAFDDDRDERSTGPDHRHRCYAESSPAPRALAHQEAYCLSSAFPVCPTFQDWARREAARARSAAAAEELAAANGDPADLSQRNPPRNWAEPPPWLSRRGRGSDAAWDEDADDELFDAAAPVHDDVPRRGRGLSGSYADRVAADPAEAIPGGLPDEPESDPHATPEPVANIPARVRHRERDPGLVAALSGESEARPRGAGGPGGPGGPGSRPDRRHEGPAPEWERAKPLEAYPTLRSRRLPELSVPPILVAAVALALAAAVLFALPGLLGFGNPQAGASASPTVPVRTQLPSLNPTPIPQPTPVTYVVKSGDTMSRIAGRFGIPLEELIAANAENIPNPDQLQIGDVVIIPVVLPTALPAASEIPAAP